MATSICRLLGVALVAASVWPSTLSATEGPTIAGPIGGTDIRSAHLPPPGLYGGAIFLGSPAYEFHDGRGNPIPALESAHLTKYISGPFLIYVPDVQVLKGSIGVAGIVPMGATCGRLLASERSKCKWGIGDPYIEAAWSRSFGQFRPSKYPRGLPVHGGLAIAFGLGVVLPLGEFDSSTPTRQARSPGANIYDLAPSVAATYTTPPVLADGTEFSAKVYWNEYFKNPETDYSTGSLVNVDFAITERIGRLQAGFAGVYVKQVTDDRRRGVRVPPDGNRAEGLALGGIAHLDLPKHQSGVKLKALSIVQAENSVKFWSVAFGWIRRF